MLGGNGPPSAAPQKSKSIITIRNVLGIIVATFAVLVGCLLAGVFNSYFRQAVKKGEGRLVGLIPAFADIPYAFKFEDVPDLTGKVALVTGANSGIGLYTALHLAKNGATTILACRDGARCSAARSKITKETGAADSNIDMMLLDLSSLHSVDAFTQWFETKYERLDILVLNAGTLFGAPYELSEDGIERLFATNHVGHFLVYKRLAVMLEKTAAKMGDARVVVTSSSSHHRSFEWGVATSLERINNKTLYDEKAGYHNYAQSKLANVLFAQEAAKRTKGKNVFINSANPGICNTNIASGTPKRAAQGLKWLIGERNVPMVKSWFESIRSFVFSISWNSETGALTQTFLATSPLVKKERIHGKYFHQVAVESTPSRQARNETLQREVWDFTEALLEELGFAHHVNEQ
mmetsp:Transcript_6229/g.15724  ORF Transcript_6229/g.15724 Transcript_6229/m.15724 type:complete len:407 (-) Transcript_6229:123-1343(-)